MDMHRLPLRRPCLLSAVLAALLLTSCAGTASPIPVSALPLPDQPMPTRHEAPAPSSSPLPGVSSAIPPTSTRSPCITATPPGMVLAHVTRIVDGDTIYVEINGQREKLRYIGIDTPEQDFPFYDESTAANRALVDGQDVLLEPDVSERDQYGRLLAYVYLTSGLFVNAELVSMGLAESIAYPPDTKHEAELDALERKAQDQGLGMWAASHALPLTPGAGFAVIIDRSCSRFDSPGNDEYSKQEEYVCVTNRGTGTVDMTGWWIRDEAGAAYSFPPFSLRAGASVKVRTGCGQDTATDLHWCRSGTAVWNNGGDTAYLYDSANLLVARLTY
jgi:endonuclease YncB( thermonuclease family)